ncbi:hypothetical protein AADI13_13145, partial [Klebsiella pneumoniae]
GKNSLNRLIRCVCGKKIGPDPRNFNQRVSLGRNDLLIRTFPNIMTPCSSHEDSENEPRSSGSYACPNTNLFVARPQQVSIEGKTMPG